MGDETITDVSNTYRITFSDAANSGDQQLLKCRVDACTTDGCQPRTSGLKGLFQVGGDSITADSETVAAEMTHFTSGTFYIGDDGNVLSADRGAKSATSSS